MLWKKVLSSADVLRREDYILDSYSVTISRACGLIDYSQSEFYLMAVKNDLEIMDTFREYANRFGKYGFWLLFCRMRGK